MFAAAAAAAAARCICICNATSGRKLLMRLSPLSPPNGMSALCMATAAILCLACSAWSFLREQAAHTHLD